MVLISLNANATSTLDRKAGFDTGGVDGRTGGEQQEFTGGFGPDDIFNHFFGGGAGQRHQNTPGAGMDGVGGREGFRAMSGENLQVKKEREKKTITGDFAMKLLFYLTHIDSSDNHLLGSR